MCILSDPPTLYVCPPATLCYRPTWLSNNLNKLISSCWHLIMFSLHYYLKKLLSLFYYYTSYRYALVKDINKTSVSTSNTLYHWWKFEVYIYSNLTHTNTNNIWVREEIKLLMIIRHKTTPIERIKIKVITIRWI